MFLNYYITSWINLKRPLHYSTKSLSLLSSWNCVVHFIFFSIFWYCFHFIPKNNRLVPLNQNFFCTLKEILFGKLRIPFICLISCLGASTLKTLHFFYFSVLFISFSLSSFFLLYLKEKKLLGGTWSFAKSLYNIFLLFVWVVLLAREF